MNDYTGTEARVQAYYQTGNELRIFCAALQTLQRIDPSWSAERYSLGNGNKIRLERFKRGVDRQSKFGNPRAKMFLSALAAERVKARLK